MTERELFEAHGMAQPTRAQLDAIWWAQVIDNPVVAERKAPEDVVAVEAHNRTTEAYA